MHSDKNLNKRKKYVTLQLNESYITSKIEHKGGKIIEKAGNHVTSEAKTVKNITGCQFYDLRMQVIKPDYCCGFYTVSQTTINSTEKMCIRDRNITLQFILNNLNTFYVILYQCIIYTLKSWKKNTYLRARK